MRRDTTSRSYAVLWSVGDETASGRLDPVDDGFELSGRDRRLSVRFADLARASIGRRGHDRVRGLPVLALERRRGDAPVRIASLQGSGVLHELVAHVERSGLTVRGG